MITASVALITFALGALAHRWAVRRALSPVRLKTYQGLNHLRRLVGEDEIEPIRPAPLRPQTKVKAPEVVQ